MMTIAKQRLFTLIAIAIVVALVSIELSAVNVCLPQIAHTLNLSVSRSAWVMNAYAIAWAVFLLPVGKLSDIFSKTKIYYIGILLFALSTLVAGFSDSDWLLIGCRFVQGMGAAILFPLSTAIASVMYPKQERGIVMGTLIMVSCITIAAGPLVGGVVGTYLSWRWLFWGAAFLSVFALLICLMAFPESIKQVVSDESTAVDKTRVSAVQLLKNRYFMIGCGTRLTINACFLAVLFINTFYFNTILKHTEIVSGLLFLPLTVMIAALSFFIGRRLKNAKFGRYLILGELLALIAFVLLVLLVSNHHIVQLLIAQALLGIALGIIYPTSGTMVVRDLSEQLAGRATSIYYLATISGNVIGVLVANFWLQYFIGSYLQAVNYLHFLHAYAAVMITCFLITLICLMATMITLSRQ